MRKVMALRDQPQSEELPIDALTLPQAAGRALACSVSSAPIDRRTVGPERSATRLARSSEAGIVLFCAPGTARASGAAHRIASARRITLSARLETVRRRRTRVALRCCGSRTIDQSPWYRPLSTQVCRLADAEQFPIADVCRAASQAGLRPSTNPLREIAPAGELVGYRWAPTEFDAAAGTASVALDQRQGPATIWFGLRAVDTIGGG